MSDSPTKLEKTLWTILDGHYSIVTEALGKQVVGDLYEYIQALLTAEYQQGQRDALEALLKNASGGGNWRRLIATKLNELEKEDEKDE